MACPLGTNERQSDMCTGEVCYSWHYVPWANIACVMILLATYGITKHYATKWLDNFLADRRILRGINAQQRLIYRDEKV